MIYNPDADIEDKNYNDQMAKGYGPGTPVDYAGHTPADVGAVSAYPTPGVFQGGQYPEDLTVTAYSVPSLFDRLPEMAVQINQNIKGAGFPEAEALTRQMLAMGEEVGEFQGAVRRFYGMARRRGSWEHVLEEWADIIITGFVTANTLGLSRAQMEHALKTKLDIIFSRGWHETVQDNIDTAQEIIDFDSRGVDEIVKEGHSDG